MIVYLFLRIFPRFLLGKMVCRANFFCIFAHYPYLPTAAKRAPTNDERIGAGHARTETERDDTDMML